MSSEKSLFDDSQIRSSVTAGFKNTFRAVSLILKSKGLFLYFTVPFLLNIVILSLIFFFTYTSLIPLIQNALAGEQWYMQFLRIMVSPVLFILLSIFTVLIYSIAGSIITAPFLDLLSSRTEKISGSARPDEKFSFTEFLSDIFRALANSIRLLVLIVMINILLLVLNVIPGGSFIYALLNFFSALFFYGFQFYDFPLERRKFGFNDKLKITWKFRRSVLGTGLSFFVISFVPVIGFLGLNLCTMGAAITFTEDINPALSGKGSRTETGQQV